MDSTRPIRALVRGLDALTFLNLRGIATVSEIAEQIRLPRTTVYRIVDTLCEAGFVHRRAGEEHFRVTRRVRDLSSSLRDDAWVERQARSLVEELGRELAWPVSLATFGGALMTLRLTTDHASPLALERFSAGMQWPLLGSAAGTVFLASCSTAQRDGLLAKCSAQERAALLREADQVRTLGFAAGVGNKQPGGEHMLSVPVWLTGSAPAVLSVRLPLSGAASCPVTERTVPKLHRCAERLSASYSEHKAAAPVPGAPQAAA